MRNPDDLTRHIANARTRAEVLQDDLGALQRCVRLLDLTSLEATDTDETVRALCRRAIQAKVGAVCVYGRFVQTAAAALDGSAIPVAAVAMGFPHGQSPLAARLLEVELAVADGAREIDIVIQRGEALNDRWDSVYREIAAARQAAPDVCLKVILETGELRCSERIYRASRVAIDAGADFIKTSTGKGSVGATPAAAATMLQAIADSGQPVGFKAAGGIRTIPAALCYQLLAEAILEIDTIDATRLRIGASSLLNVLAQPLGLTLA